MILALNLSRGFSILWTVIWYSCSLVLESRHKVQAGILPYYIKSEEIKSQMSFKDPNALEVYSTQMSKKKGIYTMLLKPGTCKKLFLFESVNQVPPEKLQRQKNSRHMKESANPTEKISTWKLELKTATSRHKKTVQWEQGWNLPWLEGWIQRKEHRTGHSRTRKGEGRKTSAGLIWYCSAK